MSSMKDALKAAGLSGRKIKQGGVYLVKDELLSIPPRTAKRTLHEWRAVVVLQCQEDCDNPVRTTLLCAPTSASGTKAVTDYDLPKGTGGLERDSVLRLALLQPIAKADLAAELGQLDAETPKKIQTVLMVNFGILPRPKTK